MAIIKQLYDGVGRFDRRGFVQSPALGVGGLSISGCDKLEGLGERAASSPLWSPSWYEFSVNFYDDGHIDVTADPAKVVLLGLHALGRIPTTAYYMGHLLLALTEPNKDAAWYIKVAGTALAGLKKKEPSYYDYDAGGLLYTAATKRFKVMTGGSSSPTATDTGEFELAGTWSGLTDGGGQGTYQFVRVSDFSYQVLHRGSRGAFEIFSDQQYGKDGSSRVLNGAVTWFVNSPKNGRRTRRLVLTVESSRQISAETDDVAWDRYGNEIHRGTLRFPMTKLT